MDRFDVIFEGKAAPGQDQAVVEKRFAEIFEITDQQRLKPFFSGKTVTLRRRVDRPTAEKFREKLQAIGVLADIIPCASVNGPSEPPPTAEPKSSGKAVFGVQPSRLDKQGQRPQPQVTERPVKPQVTSGWQQKISRAENTLEIPTRQTGGNTPRDNQWAVSEAKKHSPQATGTIEKQVAAEAEKSRRQQQAQEKIAAANAAAQAEKKRLQETAKAKLVEEKKAKLAKQQHLIAAAEAEEKRKAQKAITKAAEEEAAALVEKKRQQEKAKARAAAEKAAVLAEEKRLQEQARVKAEAAKAAAIAKKKQLQQEAKKKAAAEKAAAVAEKKRLQQAAKEKAAAEKKRLQEAARAKAAAEKAAAAKKKRQQEEARKQAAAEKKRLQQQAQMEAAAKKRAAQEEKKRQQQAAAKAAKEKAAAEMAAKAKQKRLLREEKARQEAQEAVALAKQKQQAEQARKEAAAKEKQRAKEQKRRAKLRREKERRKQRVIDQWQIAEQARARVDQKKQQHKAEMVRAAEQAQKSALSLQAKIQQEADERAAAQKIEAAVEAEGERKQEETRRLDAGLKTIGHRVRRKKPPHNTAVGKTAPGAPNLYELHAFRNTVKVQERAQHFALLKTWCFGGAIICTLIALLLLIRSGFWPSPEMPGTPRGLSSNSSGKLLVLATDRLLLHDRAGVFSKQVLFEELGVSELSPPLQLLADNTVLAHGQLADSSDEDTAHRLLRCTLDVTPCRAFAPKSHIQRASALAQHPRTGHIFVTDSSQQKLLKLSPSETLLAAAELPFVPGHRMQFIDGLLFLNEADKPFMHVLRADDKAFGNTLKHMPVPAAGEKNDNTDTLIDFSWSGNSWWTLTRSTGSSPGSIKRFDASWQAQAGIRQEAGESLLQLHNWRGKTLALTAGRNEILRYSFAGVKEAPLTLDHLENVITQANTAQQTRELLWKLIWMVLLLAFATSLAAGLGFQLASSVYRQGQPQGAVPLDDKADDILWITPDKSFRTTLKTIALLYLPLAVAMSALAIYFQVPVTALTGTLLLVMGPGILWLFLYRSNPGHIGLLDSQLILADSHQLYHIKAHDNVQHRGGFVMADDVALFLGNRWLTAFDRNALKVLISPRLNPNTRTSISTLLIKLAQGRHPVATGGAFVLATTSIGLCLIAIA